MMRLLILILSINILALVKAETSNQIDRLKFKKFDDEADPTENKVEVQTCKEECKCVPDVDTVAHTPIQELKVIENSILVCSHDSKIKRIETLNKEYLSNMTCNGVVATKKDLDENSFIAVFEDNDEDQNEKKERRESINIKHKYSISHFSQGSESHWSRGVIRNTECADDVIISYGHWVVDDPLYGCCKEGVNLWTSVYYKVEVKGKCCSTCWLLRSAYASDKLLRN